MLIKDEDFVEKIILRYRELRNTVLSEDYLYEYIDGTVSYLDEAINRNFEVWGYTFNIETTPIKIHPDYRNPENYSEAIDQLKYFIHVRGSWLDKNIESLRQYFAGSRNKKFDADAN